MAVERDRIATDDLSRELLRQVMASADLPEAVGPRITTRSGSAGGEGRALIALSGSSRAPRNRLAEPEKRQHQDETARRPGSPQASCARANDSALPTRHGVRPVSGIDLAVGRLALIHSLILRVGATPYRPFAGCSRSGSAAPGRARGTRRATGRTGSSAVIPPQAARSSATSPEGPTSFMPAIFPSGRMTNSMATLPVSSAAHALLPE